ncbi:MAG: hypothetical protein NUV54_01010 [Candidatus Taylorbacteria bacterium]|nr:hypothetical protein [Candidatus Taylorbacteria bacterium]
MVYKNEDNRNRRIKHGPVIDRLRLAGKWMDTNENICLVVVAFIFLLVMMKHSFALFFLD